METVHLPGDEPVDTAVADTATTPEGVDSPPESMEDRVRSVISRLAAGEIVDPSEVNPQTHGAELVALVGQCHRHGSRVEIPWS